jgi:uncharacterized tellurite resistance protein B-like protein
MIHIFDSSDKKKIKSHLQNIINIANADGKIDESEKLFIEKAGKKFGITTEEISILLDKKTAHDFHPPVELEERFEFLYDLMMMILADGKIDDSEMKIFKSTIISLSFDHKKSNQITQFFIDMIQNKENPDSALKNFKKLLLS